MAWRTVAPADGLTAARAADWSVDAPVSEQAAVLLQKCLCLLHRIPATDLDILVVLCAKCANEYWVREEVEAMLEPEGLRSN
jgi:hypothetical protein